MPTTLSAGSDSFDMMTIVVLLIVLFLHGFKRPNYDVRTDFKKLTLTFCHVFLVHRADTLVVELLRGTTGGISGANLNDRNGTEIVVQPGLAAIPLRMSCSG